MGRQNRPTDSGGGVSFVRSDEFCKPIFVRNTVVVGKRNDRSACTKYAGIASCACTAVNVVRDESDLECPGDRGCRVLRTVVDDDDLVWITNSLISECLKAGTESGGAIIGADDDTYGG